MTIAVISINKSKINKMKKLSIVFLALIVITFFSCNNNSTPKEDTSSLNKDSVSMQGNTTTDKDITMLSATFTSVDPGVSVFMKSLVQNYLAVKNALTNTNESAAAAASAKIVMAIKGFDKSLLTAEQKKVYDNIEDDLKEHAEHVAMNKIDLQREDFSMMSKDVYELVKAFGGGMILYHDHCPMYDNNKGAMWLSESKEIRNPYFGDKMMTCGTVEEMFK